MIMIVLVAGKRLVLVCFVTIRAGRNMVLRSFDPSIVRIMLH